LKMLEVSLIAGIFLIVHFEKKYSRHALAVGVFAYLLLVFGLNVLCNLFRMIILVAMKWMPNTLLHELTGILCFVVYVILPAIYISRMIVKKWGIIYKQSANFPKEFSAADGRKILMLLLLFVAGGLQFKYRNTRNAPQSQLSAISGYQLSASAEGISKYFDGHTLVYIKPVRVFFDTDHQPMLCWKGSGYVFAHVKAVDMHGYRVYMAQLKKGDNQLFSAWWYSNGKRSTISQWDWRSQMLQGGGSYYLINVTCATVTELGKAIEEWHINKWLSSDLLIHSGSIGLFNNP
ncbi:MAG: exosortase N, partial [Chitinophagaceae bacterium]|nr:exosortase N [Chitinophagaceae bacterium]